MFVRDLTIAECNEALKRATIARLACAHDNQPYVVPVHIYFDGEHIYGFATLGQKIAWMRENPRVCIQVDEITDRFHWSTVVLFGTYEELLHMPAHQSARRHAQELFRTVPEWWQPASTNVGAPVVRMAMVYRIRIQTMTGRLAERRPQDAIGRPWWLDLLFEGTDDARSKKPQPDEIPGSREPDR